MKGYPSLFLFENGEYVEQYKKERSIERMNKWLNDRLPDEPAKEDQPVAEEAAEAEPHLILPGPGSGIDKDTAEDPEPARNAEDEAEKTTLEVQRTRAGEGRERLLVAGGQTTGNTAVEAAQTTTSESEAVRARPVAEQMRDTLQDGEAAPPPPLLRIQQHHKRISPNPEGQVQHLKTSELEALLDPESAQGPVFVKYYAPWCSHCKRLAPTWKELAHNLRNRVNVVEFNCDASENKAKCRAEGIAGYPTLIFYQGGEKAEYRGGRSLAQMEQFANKAALS